MKDNVTLKEASALAHSMYEVANAIETELLDEKWRTASKLKNAANDSYFYMAQVFGAGKAQALEFDCISARKNLNTLKAMYVFAAKQNMTELDPALVVKIEKMISEIDAAQESSQTEVKRKAEEELKPWLEKYRIWQQISKN
jgi:site-specific recombinase XerD